MNYDKILETALEAARAGGAIIREGFSRLKTVEYKGYADPVTEFDKGSEKAIIDIIGSAYPEHSILTEEELSKQGDKKITWIIDPIDGTINFIRGLPFSAVSIGLEVEGEIVAAVVYNPLLEELFHAVTGKGAFLNNQPISVSKTEKIDEIFLATGFPYVRDGRMDDLLKPLPTILTDYQGMRRLGSAAIDLAYVACGRFDGYYEENLNPWDTAAGMLLVKEAGGNVSDYYNGTYTPFTKTILATNGLIHNRLVDLLKGVKYSSPGSPA